MKLVVGQTIPLTLQLFDRSTSKYPRAVVRNSAGTTLTTIDLTHVANGFYQDASYALTDVPYVSVQYLVYSDSGHTTLDTTYASVLETFERDDLLTTPEIETGYTLKSTLRLILSALAGKLSGAATTTVTIRDVGDSANRITATVDESGNRSAVTYNVS